MAGCRFHADGGMDLLNGQREGHGSSPEEAALQEAEGFTAEEIAWMRRLGWTPEPASSSDAGMMQCAPLNEFKQPLTHGHAFSCGRGLCWRHCHCAI